jgi:hypothetical protein
MQLVREKRMP